MNLLEFISFHKPALQRQSARHNIILSLLEKPDKQNDLEFWSFDEPGECAVWKTGRNLILGDLKEHQCMQLAGITGSQNYSGVMGPDKGPEWFVAFAEQHGIIFKQKQPMRILQLLNSPGYPDMAPGVKGQVQKITQNDFDLFYEWTIAFINEAIPDDPVPTIDELKKQLEQKPFYFWMVNGEPVSMAGVMRDFGRTVAISAVYTPPEKRGRGYAGSVVASLSDIQLAAGREVICLYTDANVPASNRCYEKIGFTQVCEVSLYPVKKA